MCAEVLDCTLTTLPSPLTPRQFNIVFVCHLYHISRASFSLHCHLHHINMPLLHLCALGQTGDLHFLWPLLVSCLSIKNTYHYFNVNLCTLSVLEAFFLSFSVNHPLFPAWLSHMHAQQIDTLKSYHLSTEPSTQHSFSTFFWQDMSAAIDSFRCSWS